MVLDLGALFFLLVTAFSLGGIVALGVVALTLKYSGDGGRVVDRHE